MAVQLQFALLGPLEVRRAGVLVPLAAGRQRALLAALLLRAGQVVPASDLIEALWEDWPPPTAQAGLHNYVRRLRRALADRGHEQIVTCPQGYLIKTGPGALDVTRFEALLSEAHTAAQQGSWQAAAGQAHAALKLWRGEPLADTGSQSLTLREVPRLVELRLQALEVAADAGLGLGQHAGLIGELRGLVARYPLRERLYALLMLALYRDDRQAEALFVYQHARQVLTEELGTEPGPGLRELHQQILTTDPALGPARSRQPGMVAKSTPPRTLPPPATGPVPVPRELPLPVAHFVGRAAELGALTTLLDQTEGQQPGTVVISAIGGTAGVGKTELAVHWAHQVADLFPDGQLYVNLRGYAPGPVMPAAEALAGFLRALGVPGQDIPPEEDQRAARYRSLLARRRILVLLDNAASAEQVRPLLPGTPACATVITSRDSLAGLVARDGARRLDLDLLPLADAVVLLQALIGERAAACPEAVSALACLCCRLPLALRVAAELAAARPATPLTELASELADQQHRLDVLDASQDSQTAVRAVFSWSYQHLPNDAARAFRLLALHPGPHLDTHAAAALTSTTAAQAHRVLNLLARAHLAQPAGFSRYTTHDLLKAYARELAAAHDGQHRQQAALTRLFDHYLHTAITAVDALYPADRHTRPHIPAPASPTPALTDPAAARAWLDDERATLVAITAHAATNGWPTHATRLADTLYHRLEAGGYYPEAIAIHTHARDSARRMGDLVAEATALNHLAAPHWRQGRHQQAIELHHKALGLSQQAGDHAGQAFALNGLAMAHADQGSYQAAMSLHEQALNLYRQIHDQINEARMLLNLGCVEERLGRYHIAHRHLRQSLAITQQTGARTTEAIARINLATVALAQGHYQQASGHLHRALTLCREYGCRSAEAAALSTIGVLRLRQGRCHEATGHLQTSLALYREMGSRPGEADVLNSLGEAQLAIGQPSQVGPLHTAALALACQLGDRYQQARAHQGLGNTHHTAGDTVVARQHWKKAHALYISLGTPQASQLHAQLITIAHHISGEIPPGQSQE